MTTRMTARRRRLLDAWVRCVAIPQDSPTSRSDCLSVAATAGSGLARCRTTVRSPCESAISDTTALQSEHTGSKVPFAHRTEQQLLSGL